MRPDVAAAMAERKRRRNRMVFIRAAFRVLAIGVVAILLLTMACKAVAKNKTGAVEAYAADTVMEAAMLEVPMEKIIENCADVETETPAAEPEQAAPELDEAMVEMLACRIYWEAGGDSCSDLCRYYCGDVMLNRVNDPRFPDTLEGVLTQKKQYGRFYWTGIVWPERAKKPGEAHAVQRAYDTARDLLSGNHSELYGAGYVWQAEFKQGKDIIYLDGMYFGR